MMIKTIYFPLLILLLAGNMFGQGTIQISCTINNYNGKKAYLKSIYGSRKMLVDSAGKKNNTFIFKGVFNPGLYSFELDDSLFAEIIINNENIVLQTNANDIIKNMVVLESEENKVFYNYWKTSLPVNNQLDMIAYEGRKLMQQLQWKPSIKLDSLQSEFEYLNNWMEKFSDSIIDANKDKFVGKLLKAFQMPSYTKYLDTAKSPLSYEQFIKQFYFVNIDFSDERLLNTDVIYTTITNYLSTYLERPTTLAYVENIDFIISQADKNDEVRKYITELFVNNLERSIWEKVYVYVVDSFYLKLPNIDKDLRTYHHEKSDYIKKIQIGEIAPDFNALDTANTPASLHKINPGLKLLIFLGPDCESCVEMIPKVKEVYDLYHPNGFDVVAFAITDDEKLWKEKIRELDMNWVNISDLKGLETDLINIYNIWLTPSMFILDKENKIISRPRTQAEIYAKIIETLYK